MASLFKQHGAASFVACCDWHAPLCETATIFATADIVIGMHGAGLYNVAMARNGVVLIELKSPALQGWKDGVLHLLAQGSHGGYIWANTWFDRARGKGSSLSLEAARVVVECGVALWNKDPQAPCSCQTLE